MSGVGFSNFLSFDDLKFPTSLLLFIPEIVGDVFFQGAADSAAVAERFMYVFDARRQIGYFRDPIVFVFY